MIQANHKAHIVKVFNFYSKYYLNKHFRTLEFEGDLSISPKPLLILSNHFTWWDGFIQYYLNRLYFKKKFHVMMLEDQLQKNMILNKAGAFSVKKNSRGLIDSVNYSIDILKDSKNMLLIFPQGEIQSLYTDTYHFQKGIEHIINRSKSDIQLIFNINLIDYFSFKKPSLKVIVKKVDIEKPVKTVFLEEQYNEFAQSHKLRQKEK
jgi:1-acyl-sn-glycerol-3-phosphate acyltransferase